MATIILNGISIDPVQKASKLAALFVLSANASGSACILIQIIVSRRRRPASCHVRSDHCCSVRPQYDSDTLKDMKDYGATWLGSP